MSSFYQKHQRYFALSWKGKDIFKGQLLKWLLASATGRGIVSPNDISHPVWAIQMETYAIWNLASRRDFSATT